MERKERMWQINYLVNNFAGRHQATLPVILICSHDGDAQPPGVPKRTGQGLPSGCNFEPDRDLKTQAFTTGDSTDAQAESAARRRKRHSRRAERKRRDLFEVIVARLRSAENLHTISK